MIDFILKIFGIKTCTHANVDTTKEISYCPDCGKLIRINWYIIRCRCCGKKRIGILRGNKPAPLARFCTNCGTENYSIEKINNLNYFNMNFAIAKKEEENLTELHDYTTTWVEENEIIKNLKYLPQYLN